MHTIAEEDEEQAQEEEKKQKDNKELDYSMLFD